VVVDETAPTSSSPRETVDTDLLAALSVGVIVTAAMVALAALVGVRVYYLRQMRQQGAAASPPGRGGGGGGVRSPKVTPAPPPHTRALSVEVLTPSSPVKLEEETASLMDRVVSALERGDGEVTQQQQQQQQQRSPASLSQASVVHPGGASESEDEGPAVRRLFTATRA
jgi:hypothetical protein